MDAVLTETYSVFGDLKLYHPNTSIKNIPEILCMAAEYRDLSDFLKTKETGDALMKLEKTLKANGMLPKPMFRSFEGKRIEKFFNHFRGNKLAFLVLYAHLHRVEITNANLEKAQQKVLKKMPLLIESLANIGEERTKACGANPRFIAMAAQWLMTVHNVLVFSQCLTQAGKYSKRRCGQAVIIDRILFIGAFLFNCLLLNHSFQTNPNKITNCFKLILFYLQLYKLHLLNAFVYF